MATPRTALRGPAFSPPHRTGLAGAGVASATASEHSVDGTVTVDFALEG